MAGKSLREFAIDFFLDVNKGSIERVMEQADVLKRKLQSLRGPADAFNEVFMAASTLARPFIAFGEMVAETAAVADEMQDLADNTGMAADEIQKLDYIAAQNATSGEALRGGLKILTRQLAEAASGSAGAQEKFAAFGIKTRDASGKVRAAGDVLADVSEKVRAAKTDTERTGIAMEFFGRSGGDLVAMLKQGPEVLAAFADEMNYLGGTFSKEFLKDSSMFVDNMNRLKQVFTGVKAAVAGPFVAAMNSLTKTFLEFWKVNGLIIRSGLKSFFEGIAYVVRSVFEMIGTAARAFWDFTKPLRDVAEKLGLMKSALIALVYLFGAPTIAALAFKAVIALIVDDLLNFAMGNESVTGAIVENWDEIVAAAYRLNPGLGALTEAFGWFAAGVRDGLGALWRTFSVFAEAWKEGKFLKELSDAFDVSFQYYKDVVVGFGTYVLEYLSKLGTRIRDAIVGAAKGALYDLGITDFVAKAKMVGSMLTAPVTPRFGSEGSSTVQNSTNAPQMQLNMTVNAGGGGDGRELSKQIADQVQEQWDSMTRATAATVPGTY